MHTQGRPANFLPNIAALGMHMDHNILFLTTRQRRQTSFCTREITLLSQDVHLDLCPNMDKVNTQRVSPFAVVNILILFAVVNLEVLRANNVLPQATVANP